MHLCRCQSPRINRKGCNAAAKEIPDFPGSINGPHREIGAMRPAVMKSSCNPVRVEAGRDIKLAVEPGISSLSVITHARHKPLVTGDIGTSHGPIHAIFVAGRRSAAIRQVSEYPVARTPDFDIEEQAVLPPLI